MPGVRQHARATALQQPGCLQSGAESNDAHQSTEMSQPRIVAAVACEIQAKIGEIGETDVLVEGLDKDRAVFGLNTHDQGVRAIGVAFHLHAR